jgi:hypothetical protein
MPKPMPVVQEKRQQPGAGLKERIKAAMRHYWWRYKNFTIASHVFLVSLLLCTISLTVSIVIGTINALQNSNGDFFHPSVFFIILKIINMGFSIFAAVTCVWAENKTQLFTFLVSFFFVLGFSIIIFVTNLSKWHHSY